MSIENNSNIKKAKTVMDRAIAILALILVIALIVMFISFKIKTSGISDDVINQSVNSETIEELTDKFNTTLAIPQSVSSLEDLTCENYNNMLAILTSEDTGIELAFADFTNVLACPLGIYKEFEFDKFYSCNTGAVDFIRIRISDTETYITYKYLDLAYTLKMPSKMSETEALGCLGLTLADVKETDAENLNEQFGVSKTETAESAINTGVYGQYKIDFNADDFGLIYGINIDGSVNFYLDNRLLMTVTDTLDENVDGLGGIQDCELYRSSVNDKISLIWYNQKYELNTDEYTAYNSLIMIIDSLAENIDYAK